MMTLFRIRRSVRGRAEGGPAGRRGGYLGRALGDARETSAARPRPAASAGSPSGIPRPGPAGRSRWTRSILLSIRTINMRLPVAGRQFLPGYAQGEESAPMGAEPVAAGRVQLGPILAVGRTHAP